MCRGAFNPLPAHACNQPEDADTCNNPKDTSVQAKDMDHQKQTDIEGHLLRSRIPANEKGKAVQGARSIHVDQATSRKLLLNFLLFSYFFESFSPLAERIQKMDPSSAPPMLTPSSAPASLAPSPWARANLHGRKLGASHFGAELGAVDAGAELGAVDDGAEHAVRRA